MNLRYHGGTFAHGRRDTLRGTRSYVADREYPSTLVSNGKVRITDTVPTS
jgi:hypothetical protein